MKLSDVSDERLQSLLEEGTEVSQIIKAFRSLRFGEKVEARRGIGTSRTREQLRKLEAEEAVERRKSR